MEVIGLAVGVAGLLSVCFDLLDRIDCYKAYGVTSRQAVARFDAARLRLKEWSQNIGIIDGKLQDKHHYRLDQPEVAAVMRTILSSIQQTFDTVDKNVSDISNEPNENNKMSFPRFSLHRRNTGGQTGNGILRPNRHAVHWAISRKSQFTGHLETLEILIQHLYDLVPPSIHARHDQRTGDALSVSMLKVDLDVQNSDALKNVRQELELISQTIRRKTLQQAYKDVDLWLKAPSPDQQILDRSVSTRLEGTCEWLMDHKMYKDWASPELSDDKAKIFWLCGPAGHGKSILTARVVQLFQQQSDTILAFFFSSNHVQAGGQPEEIVRSWVSQLTKADDVALAIVQEHPQWEKASHQATESDVWELFRNIILEIGHCHLILDGYDEYENVDDCRKDFLLKLIKSLMGTTTRLFIASRPETDIESLLMSSDLKKTLAVFECRVSNTLTKNDIDLYCTSVVTEQLPKKDRDLHEELARKMADKCGGMFLWIKLQRAQLRDGKSKSKLRSLVDSMPDGLYSSFERNWLSIQKLPDEDRDRAKMILRWAVFAKRPLTVVELTEALLVKPDNDGNDNFDPEDLPDEIDEQYINDEIKGLCGSLIEVRFGTIDQEPASRTVHLVHVLVKEYLLAVLPTPDEEVLPMTLATKQEYQNMHLTKTCVAYIDRRQSWTHAKRASDGCPQDTFLRYAIDSLEYHMEATRSMITDATKLFNRWLTPASENLIDWVHCQTIITTGQVEIARADISCDGDVCLYLASLYNLWPTMDFLHASDDVRMDIVPCAYGTALQAACVMGHKEAFDRLIAWGANVDSKAGVFETAIHAACWRGDESMVHTLLKCGANIRVLDSAKEAPLNNAVTRGWTGIVRTLLEHGADLSSRNVSGRTVLGCAISSGNVDMVKALLEHGASISDPQENGWSVLALACASNHIEILKILLKQNANVRAQDILGRTPLHIAALYGRTDAVRLLVKNNANVDGIDKEHLTPLHHAVCKLHNDVITVLVEGKADLSITDMYGRSVVDWLHLYDYDQTLITAWAGNYCELPVNDRRFDRLRDTLTYINRNLCENAVPVTQSLSFLGRCFLHWQMDDDAVFAFLQQMNDTDEKGNGIFSSVFCDACKADPIVGNRWVCRVCPEVDVCQNCKDDLKNKQEVRMCWHHDFILVPGVNVQTHAKAVQSASELSDEVKIWLNNKVGKYGQQLALQQ